MPVLRFEMLRSKVAPLILTSVFCTMAAANEIDVPGAPGIPALSLPAFDGEFGVGVRAFSWTDASRTRTGLSGDGGNREIDVTVWYPARETAGRERALYFPTLEGMLAGADTLPPDQKRYVLLHAPLRNVRTNSVPAAPPLLKDGGWPLILFSPGGNVSSHAQTALAEHVASRGYVFVSMAHPYSSIDVAAKSGFSMSRDWDLENDDRQIADRNDNELADILASDAAFVLEELRELARDGNMPGPVMDFDRTGIVGHSRGGKTVGRACRRDESFRVCVVLDNIGPAQERKTGINQPFMTLRSPWGDERVAELHDYLGRTGTVAYDVELADSNHFSCSDLPIFIADLRIGGVNPVDGIRACADLVTAFLDAFLRDSAGPDTDWLPAGSAGQVSVRSFEHRIDDR
jgi:hypothetical protein